jgi:hypothetical protein
VVGEGGEEEFDHEALAEWLEWAAVKSGIEPAQPGARCSQTLTALRSDRVKYLTATRPPLDSLPPQRGGMVGAARAAAPTSAAAAAATVAAPAGKWAGFRNYTTVQVVAEVLVWPRCKGGKGDWEIRVVGSPGTSVRGDGGGREHRLGGGRACVRVCARHLCVSQCVPVAPDSGLG